MKLSLVAAVTVAIVFPSVAGAQCVIFDKPEDLFARADVVFLGTLVETAPTGAQGAHVTVEIGTFRVQETWKGDLGREVRVGSDRPFERNTKYLVFAAGNPLTTSILCRWADREDRATAKLEWLAKARRVLLQSDDIGVCEREAVPLLGKKAERAGRRIRAPRKIKNVAPDYPSVPVGTRVRMGTTWMGAVLIDTTGKVVRVFTVREVQFQPPFPQFNEAIVSALRQWEFAPTTLDGTTVPVCMPVTITVDWQ